MDEKAEETSNDVHELLAGEESDEAAQAALARGYRLH